MSFASLIGPRMAARSLYAAILVCAVCRAAMAEGAAAPQAQPAAADNAVALLYPPDRSVIPGEFILVVAAAPASAPRLQVSIDGKAVEAQRMPFAESWLARSGRLYPTTRPSEGIIAAPSLRDKASKVLYVAAVTSAAGEHVVQVQELRAKVFCAKDGGPAAPQGWAVLSTHGPIRTPDEARACTICHEETPGALGLSKAPGSCQKCHEEAPLQLAHGHVIDPLSRCHRCHDPHGSTRPKLLVDAKEKLCIQCHEAGHAKN